MKGLDPITRRGLNRWEMQRFFSGTPSRQKNAKVKLLLRRRIKKRFKHETKNTIAEETRNTAL